MLLLSMGRQKLPGLTINTGSNTRDISITYKLIVVDCQFLMSIFMSVVSKIFMGSLLVLTTPVKEFDST